MSTKTIENWELKNRTYVLKNGFSPLTYKIKSKGILWFDEEKGINRQIRYSENQNSLFVDEQDGHVKMSHVVFEDGVLHVPKSRPMLQQLLSIYHPAKSKWEEVDKKKQAEDYVDVIEKELDALVLAKTMDIDHLEAVIRTEVGSAVNRMSTKEIRRDAYRLAQKSPAYFIELSEDEDIKLRNLANRAVEGGILKLTDDNTVFKFASNGKKLLTVPFDSHPYAALAQYFKTDDGVDLMKSIIKKLD